MGITFPILPDQSPHGPTGLENYFLWIKDRIRWVLEFGGERVLLYKRRYEGQLCPLYNKVRHTSQQHGQDNICQGTGYINKPLFIQDLTTGVNFTVSNISDNTHISVSSTTGVHQGDTIQQGTYTTTVTTVTDTTNLVIGDASGFTGSGYFEPLEIFVSLLSSGPEAIEVGDFGRRRIYKPRSWGLADPLFSEGDFLVRRNNQRLWIQAPVVHRWKHFSIRQEMDVVEVEKNSPIFLIPSGL